jgi:DNA-binding transcriptional LysR family regulator
MELRHLRYFVAVADEQHVGRAATRLHVSASPLSRQLRELEAEVGTPLLERVGRGIRTSPAGTTFAADARAILASVNRAVERAQAAARGEAGHLAIGFTESAVFAQLIPALAGAFRREHPNVTLELVPLSNEDLRLALRTRKIGAGLSFGIADPERTLRHELLFAERVVLALPRAHPLARRQRLLLRDLHDQPFVWSARPEHAPLLDVLWAWLSSRGVTPRIVIESRATILRLSLVASGIGLTFVADSSPPPPEVVIKTVADLKLRAKAHLLWREEDEATPLVRSLRELAHDVARREATRTRRERREE